MSPAALSSLVEIHAKGVGEGHRHCSLQATTFSQRLFIPLRVSRWHRQAAGRDCCSQIPGKGREAEIWQSAFILETLTSLSNAVRETL